MNGMLRKYMYFEMKYMYFKMKNDRVVAFKQTNGMNFKTIS